MLTFIALATFAQASKIYAIESLDLKAMRQDWGTPQVNRSVDKNPLRIAGKTYARGIGTHATSVLYLKLDGKGTRFQAMVGVDDESANQPATVEFRIYGDEKPLWRSGVMKPGNAAKPVDLDLKGIKMLILFVGDGGDGINYDHADWVDASITMSSGAPIPIAAPEEKAVILTPPPPKEPRLTGAKVFGSKPGNPFLFTVTATGEKPVRFSAQGLPRGLSLDGTTGRITGTTPVAGTYKVNVTATNKHGKATRELRIVAGNTIALTPPLGWNSWNCWGGAVSQDKVLRSAKGMAQHLKDHGWTYVNIDDGWQGLRGGKYNAIMPNMKFPDMGGLATQIHDMGLKIGIYSTPWRGSYLGHIGGSADNPEGTYEWTKTEADENYKIKTNPGRHFTFGKYSFIDKDVQQWVDWEIDYLKYDWGPWKVEDVEAMSKLLRESKRDFVYSLSNSAPFPLAHEWAARSHAWRTTGDIYDAWGSVASILDTQDRWNKFAGPGHWNDPDMLVVGMVGWGPNLHPTRLTPNEQYAHISMWCLLAAPLLLGCDLENLDPFTLNLLTNDEVLAVNQDPLGKQGKLIWKAEEQEIWAKPLEDGTTAVGLYNKGEFPAKITVNWDQIGLNGSAVVRDLWRQRSLGFHKDSFSATVPRHSVTLVKIGAAKS
ncbi:MAG: NPCBM/NEW2 domain-containing protein [Fimbriimonadaceae bacterium]|nr:NPCBM/NEW2 domain-containing protein [Fimbriimonadaceae bacterium]